MESVSKSNEQADVLRAEGNQLYARKRFFDALVKYNESLCRAEPGSASLGLAYANRSAVYCELKLFDKSLLNIELARENHYPEKNLPALKKREEKCGEMMKHQKREMRPFDHIKLSYPPNKKIEYIVDCLELKVDKNFGRYIVADRPLRVGDVVAIEEPFCRIVQERFIHQRCSGCYKDNLMDLIPCSKCCKAMFCSRDCMEKSLDSFHRLECPLIEITSSSMMNSNMKMALRTFFVALSIFNGSIEKLERFISENSDSMTVFDFELPTILKQKLLAVNSLTSASSETEIDLEVFDDLFQVSSELFAMWSSHKEFMRRFLAKQIQIAAVNYHEIYSWPLKVGGLDDEEVNEFKGSLAYKRGILSTGNGSYPFSSLINHGCAPNVSRIFIDDKIALIVQRPITRGGQLFDNYGYNFTNVAKVHRQAELMSQYKFKCNCEACTGDWPLLPAVKPKDKLCLMKAKEACRVLTSGSIDQAKAFENFKEICEILESCKTNFPSLELLSLMQSANAFLELSLKPNFQF